MKINGKSLDDYIVKIKGVRTEIGKFVKIKNIKVPTIMTNEPVIDKRKITGYTGQTNSFETPKPNNQSLSLWDILKQKIQQIKPVIEQFKQSFNNNQGSKELELLKYKISEIEEKLEKAKNGKLHLNTKEIIQAEAELERLNNKKDKIEKSGRKNIFSGWLSGIKKTTSQLNQIPGITVKIKNQIKQMGNGMKQGLGHILKYAMALFSLRSIYSILSSCANSWLSSQNDGAQQLSANIEYMKYAMGSVFAPVIEYVINLVYKLMKAIQSVVYSFSGINIFAKATASSMNKTASSASKASKSLSGVHNEISNVSENDSSGSDSTTPSIDLSQMDNIGGNLLDSIKNGNWNELGSLLGEKINNALGSIPWDKIQDTARSIGSNIAEFLNGFIGTTDWSQIGNTFAQGINTLLYIGQSFVEKFNFKNFGKAIGDGLTGLIKGIDWKALGNRLSTEIKGIFDAISGFFEEFDWQVVVDGLIDFIVGFDWNGVSDSIFQALGSACASLVNLGIILGDYLMKALNNIGEFFSAEIEECGGNVVQGILKGIIDALGNLGQWIIDHIFMPFIEGFKNVFGIHSPSTVMEEMGGYIIQGLLNGIQNLVGKIGEIWNNIKTKMKDGAESAWEAVTSVFGNVKNWFQSKFAEAWTAVKNIFSTGGKIFSGIKEGITETFKTIVNKIISGINMIISIPFDKINNMLNTIRNVSFFDIAPFKNLWSQNPITVPKIPQLAKGNVAYSETMAIFGEYSGARSNPEITTPQNIMRETFEDVLSKYEGNNGNSDKPLNIALYVGNKKLGEILLDDLRDMKRRTGKNIEAIVGG